MVHSFSGQRLRFSFSCSARPKKTASHRTCSDVRRNPIRLIYAVRSKWYAGFFVCFPVFCGKSRYNRAASVWGAERENAMNETYITTELLAQYARRLYEEEKSSATIEKYIRDVHTFSKYVGSQALTKDMTIAYKRDLPTRGYTILSVNSMLASLNSFLTFCGRSDCKVRLYRVQKKTYLAANRELSRAEYQRLLNAAKRNGRLWLLLQTLCATGIRVSELQYFTVEAVRAGEISVACKSKMRCILIPKGLQKLLLQYAHGAGIGSGSIFRTRTGKPLNRSNIWAAMKRLCTQANVNPDKVFPHNLRKLFARTFYQVEKDIAKLADLLGHSSINTTRIYIMSTGAEHRRQLERLQLLAPCTT